MVAGAVKCMPETGLCRTTYGPSNCRGTGIKPEVDWTVTLAVAFFEVSAAEVAFTVKLPAADPAVKRPAVEIVPPVAVQVTAVLDEPVTVAVNCCV
jgi:hypothetical protein